MDLEMIDRMGFKPGRKLQEAQVLGCLIWRDGEGLKEISLDVDDFSYPPYRDIFAGIVDLVEDGGPADQVSLGSRLGKHWSEIAAAANTVCTGANLLWFVTELKKTIYQDHEAEARKELVSSLKGGGDHEAMIEAMQAKCAGLREKYLEPEVREDFGVVMSQFLQRIRERKASKYEKTEVPWLDRTVKGLAPGNYVTLAARPGVGKTGLLLQILLSMAKAGKRTTLISLEMSKMELAERTASHVSGIDATAASRNPAEVSAADRLHLMSLAWELGELANRVRVFDQRCSHIDQIVEIARKEALNGSALVAVDYIQLIQGPGRSVTEKLDYISPRWKSLLKDLGIPGIMVSQLTREHEREGKAPELKDLRGSGSLEQDADIVWFLHPQKDGNIFFKQAKGRAVGRAALVVRHSGATHTFCEVEGQHDQG